MLSDMLYDVEVYSELQTASPKFVANLGALLTVDKLNVNLVEKIYGPSSDYQNDDGDNPTNSNEYFRDQIGTTLIANLDVGFQFTEGLKLSIGAQNLFNRFPNKLNSNSLGPRMRPPIVPRSPSTRSSRSSASMAGSTTRGRRTGFE
jgi:iron complex outermembrane recepter protein